MDIVEVTSLPIDVTDPGVHSQRILWPYPEGEGQG